MDTLTFNELATLLFGLGVVEFGPHRFKYHEKHPDAPLSHIYINLRGEPEGHFKPELIPIIARHLYETYLVANQRRFDMGFDYVVGLPRAGEPFAEAFVKILNQSASNYWYQLIHLKKIESPEGRRIVSADSNKIMAGNKVLIIDDVLNAGETKLEAISALRALGLVVVRCLTLFDYQQGGLERLAREGIRSISSSTIAGLVAFYLGYGLISRRTHSRVIGSLTALSEYKTVHGDL